MVFFHGISFLAFWLSCDWLTWMSGTLTFFSSATERIHKQPPSALLQTVFYSKVHVVVFSKSLTQRGYRLVKLIDEYYAELRWIAHERRCSKRRSQRSSAWNGLFNIWVTPGLIFTWRQLRETLLIYKRTIYFLSEMFSTDFVLGYIFFRL